jgi:hypothetical protein
VEDKRQEFEFTTELTFTAVCEFESGDRSVGINSGWMLDHIVFSNGGEWTREQVEEIMGAKVLEKIQNEAADIYESKYEEYRERMAEE